MPLNLSSAQSSRISKRSQQIPPLLRRSASSPFNDFIRRKPIQRSKSKAEVADDGDDDFFGDRLDDIGIVKSLASDLSLRDLVQIIQYVRSHMFESMPENGGFNSTRIADILSTYFPSPYSPIWIRSWAPIHIFRGLTLDSSLKDRYSPSNRQY